MSIYGRNHYNIKKNKKHRWGARGEAQKGRDICTPVAESHCCIAESNTTLLSNYSPIKLNF